MPTPQARLDLDRVLNAIDAKAAVVIMVDDLNNLETATKGIDNDAALFEICFSVAAQLADEIFADMPDHQRKRARLAFPTAEEARRLGILKTPGSRN